MTDRQVIEEQLTEQDLINRANGLAYTVGCANYEELFVRCDAGEFRGSILESKVSMIRFLLSGEVEE